jgi:predicted dehydrogenase
MNRRPLRIGFIGGGLNSAIGCTHKIAAQMDGRFKLVAGCFSTHRDVNRATAEAWGVEAGRCHETWQDLLAREQGGLDAVVILTPTPAHLDMVLAALGAGFPVLCEKALCTSSADAERIKDTVEERSGFVGVTYNYTGYPMVRELQARIASHELGTLQQIRIEMPQEAFLRLGKDGRPAAPQRWRLQDGEVPTMALDLATHLHQMVGFLTGARPIEAVVMQNTFGHFKGVVDNCVGLARYTDNIDCHFWFGKVALGTSNGLRVQIYGSEGSAEWYQMNPEVLALADNRGRLVQLERSSTDVTLADAARYNRFKAGHPAGFIEAFANHYADLADSVAGHVSGEAVASPFVFGVATALEGLCLLEAMARSSASRSWQPVVQRGA